nr:hypothetical protein [Tanacetum cinerariifolium]
QIRDVIWFRKRGFFVGYSMNIKAFRVLNSRKGIVEENLHIRFSENTPNVVGSVPNWLFDIDALTRTMNYESIAAGTQSNGFVGTKACDNVGQARKETELVKDYILLPLWTVDPLFPKIQRVLKMMDSNLKKELCIAFEKLMHEKFQMSSMGELTFFLGLQVKKKNDGIFISQDKYVGEILKKYRFSKVKNSRTPMKTQKPLLKDEDREEVDVHMYRSMISSLMYLTPSRPAIMFVVCACARYQVHLKFYSTAKEKPSMVKDKFMPRAKKTTQANVIDSFKRRVKKLEKKQRSRIHKLKRLYKVGLTARVESSDDEQSLGEDESKQGRLSNIGADEGIILASTHDDVEMFDADKDLGGEEVFVAKQNENVLEKEVDAAQVQKRRKFFAAKRAEEKRNKPPTQAQQIKIICTYLKYMEGRKLKDLKNKSFESIQNMFDNAFKRVNTFVDFKTELVKDLYKLVKPRYGSTRAVENLDYLLWHDMKTIFEQHVEDQIWKMQQGYNVLEWKLYNSCGLHSLKMKSMYIYMLVEKKYPLTAPTLTDMLNKKLHTDHFTKMAYQLLKLITKQLKNP